MALARCNGTMLVDDDGKLGLVERGGGWVNTAIFVAVLLAFIPGGAAVALVMGGQPGGAVLLPFSAVSTVAAVLLIRHKRRASMQPA